MHHGGFWTSASRQVPTIQEIITEQAWGKWEGSKVSMFHSTCIHHSRGPFPCIPC